MEIIEKWKNEMEIEIRSGTICIFILQNGHRANIYGCALELHDIFRPAWMCASGNCVQINKHASNFVIYKYFVCRR